MARAVTCNMDNLFKAGSSFGLKAVVALEAGENVTRVSCMAVLPKPQARVGKLLQNLATRNFIAISSVMNADDLDTIDWKILKELQRDGRITNVALAGRVGLSPPPTLRRVQALEESQLITGYRAKLAGDKLGYGAQMIAHVGLKSQAEHEMREFERRVAGWPIVRECYAVSGIADFVLKLVGRDVQSIQSFIMGALAKTPNVESVKTSLILHVAKDEPEVPLP